MKLACSSSVKPLLTFFLLLMSASVMYETLLHYSFEADFVGDSTASSPVVDRKISPTNVGGKTVRVSGRIERGLEQARMAIRWAARRRKYASDKPQTFLPRGDVYHDPYAFHQSYIEMEKRFRIWSYREGMLPLVHTGPHKGPYAVEGQLMSEIDSPLGLFAAERPEDAHIFYLPVSITNIVSYVYGPDPDRSLKPLRRVWKDYVHAIAVKHPFWNRSDGADHVMVSCHDWYCCPFPLSQGPKAAKRNKRFFKNLIRLLCNANVSEGFNPSRDASLPEALLSDGELSPPPPSPPPSERTILAFFAGGNHGYIREVLLHHWKGKDDDVSVYEYLPKDVNYDEMMRRSRFCLCPSGYEVASPRPLEAIYAGCVPVIIAQGFVLPLSDVLDWSKFSVSVPVEKIPQLKNILQAITPEQYARMQRRVIKVQRHFVVNRPAKRFDLIHMSLHSVWLRRLNFRLHY